MLQEASYHQGCNYSLRHRLNLTLQTIPGSAPGIICKVKPAYNEKRAEMKERADSRHFGSYCLGE